MTCTSPRVCVLPWFSSHYPKTQNLHVRLIGGSKWECVSTRCVQVMDTSVSCLSPSGMMHSQTVFRGLTTQPADRSTTRDPHPEKTTSLLVNTHLSTAMDQRWEGGSPCTPDHFVTMTHIQSVLDMVHYVANKRPQLKKKKTTKSCLKLRFLLYFSLLKSEGAIWWSSSSAPQEQLWQSQSQQSPRPTPQGSAQARQPTQSGS